jgi:hypothetical protein
MAICPLRCGGPRGPGGGRQTELPCVRQWRGGSEIGVSLERGAQGGSNGVKIMAIGAVLTEIWLFERKFKK